MYTQGIIDSLDEGVETPEFLQAFQKRIDSEVKQEIGRLKKGDKVIISNIVVKQKGGNTRNMGPSTAFNYTIK